MGYVILDEIISFSNKISLTKFSYILGVAVIHAPEMVVLVIKTMIF